jgi:membrane-associated protease RseP (regulator of RpoE activity)
LLPAVLFVCTLAAIFVTWLGFPWDGVSTEELHRIRWPAIQGALQFTGAVVLILGSHELGHWLLARRHGVSASLPYFIPLPGVGFGTLGAVIRVRDRIPSRNALVDIGAAGPLAGFLVALPFLAWGYAHSTWITSPVATGGFPGPMSLWSMARHGVPQGSLLIFGDNLLLKGFQLLFMGPTPPGADVLAHPFVTAGWLGTLVTMLNLVPVGQLDAGHLTFALFGRRARLLGWVALLALLLLAIFASASWLVWLVVVALFVGVRHPEVSRSDEPLSPGRVWVCAATLAVGVLCFLPAPVVVG